MPPPETPPEELFADMTVLVIDDEVFMQGLTGRMLRDLGIKNILTAENGKDALSTIKSDYKNIDLILLDIEMPEIDGLQFLKMIRSTSIPEVANLRVVMLSGHSDMDNVKKCIDLGIHGFLTKPLAKEKLQARLLTVLKGEMLDAAAFEKLLGKG